MSIQIVPYQVEHIQKVQAFNARIEELNSGFVFPENEKSVEFSPELGNPIEQNFFLARESETGEVHGGYILRSCQAWFKESEDQVGHYQLPLSEGILDPKFSMVGVHLYLDAIKKQPKLYALGMGSKERPLPLFLKKMGWTIDGIPFYFKIFNPDKVIKNLPALRDHQKIKPILFLMDQLKFFSTGISLLNYLSKLRTYLTEDVEWSIEMDFGTWADEVWNKSKSQYQWIGKRDAKTLNLLYPKSSARFCRLRISKNSQDIGWALVLATEMKEHKHFPNLVVGTIADTLAIPGNEFLVTKAAEKYLASRQVDLIVSNQSHKLWGKALLRSGFFQGPSNYIAAFSAEMWKGISCYSECHINRGDGDGPINL